MYFPGKPQPNTNLSSMQRTFYPKHAHYFGSGCGRDQHITINNGGLNHAEKQHLGHQGVHIQRYNSIVQERNSPSPMKEPVTHYYMSDGTGRDSYILDHNGGSRPEYNKNFKSPEVIFASSLRSGRKSPLKYFKNHADIADITTYLNWKSTTGFRKNSQAKKVEFDVTKRLTNNGSPGSPNRIKIIKQVNVQKNLMQTMQSPRKQRDGASLDYSNDTLYRIVARKQQEANQFASPNLKTLDPIADYTNVKTNIVPNTAARHNSQIDLSMALNPKASHTSQKFSRTQNNNSKMGYQEAETDYIKNNSMTNLSPTKTVNIRRNMNRDRTVNPVRNQNRLMGLETQNDLNYQKETILNKSIQDKRIGELIRLKREGKISQNVSHKVMRTDETPTKDRTESYQSSGQFELKSKKKSIALDPNQMFSIDSKQGNKSPLPKITDSLSNYDKAAFLKKINAMRNLKQDKVNLIQSMRSNVQNDTGPVKIIRSRNSKVSTADPNSYNSQRSMKHSFMNNTNDYEDAPQSKGSQQRQDLLNRIHKQKLTQ